MKKLTTPAGIFGPYSIVETLVDRYRCDGADLPFTVVGQGSVADWIGPLPVPPMPAVAVPKSVTRFQALAALSNAGLLSSAQAAVNASTNPLVALAWNNAQAFDRNSPTIASLATALGMSSAQLDTLFIAAANIAA